MSAASLSIFLIGPMGTGKSTVGLRLARATDREFRDSDAILEERTGAAISDIFEHEGEAGFRLRERKLLDELTRESRIVLATGGGAVLEAANRRVLGARGLVVYLRTGPGTQWERVKSSSHRPLIEGEDPEGCLAHLFAERDPLYREVCDLQIEMDKRTVHEAVGEIVARLDQPS